MLQTEEYIYHIYIHISGNKISVKVYSQVKCMFLPKDFWWVACEGVEYIANINYILHKYFMTNLMISC